VPSAKRNEVKYPAKRKELLSGNENDEGGPHKKEAVKK
jgi:hypothetical protein